ncbi:MAG TPA: hypothetical protein VIJ10_04530 [Vicinamibacteria bacterium]
MRVRALSIHADYRCRMSGACCRSGWDIAVEPAAEERIRRGVADGRLRPADWGRAAAGLPHGARVLLRVLPSGDCAFLAPGEPRLCAVHKALGEDALPSACRQFPRVVTLTPLGVSLTLSHYCPTAAEMLFRDDVGLAVVSDPAAFPRSWPYEGLDARDALPPLLRPGALMSWAAHERLEQHAVLRLADESGPVAQALADFAQHAEALRGWSLGDGPLDAFVSSVLERPARGCEVDAGLAAALADWERVARAVPGRGPAPDSPRAPVEAYGLERAQAALDDGWERLRRPVGRWLAAKAFASWIALQGDGVRTTALGLRVAHSVLRAEAAREAAATRAAPSKESLKQAVRRADLLLLHLVDPQALASDLSRCEAAQGA